MFSWVKALGDKLEMAKTAVTLLTDKTPIFNAKGLETLNEAIQELKKLQGLNKSDSYSAQMLNEAIDMLALLHDKTTIAALANRVQERTKLFEKTRNHFDNNTNTFAPIVFDNVTAELAEKVLLYVAQFIEPSNGLFNPAAIKKLDPYLSGGLENFLQTIKLYTQLNLDLYHRAQAIPQVDNQKEGEKEKENKDFRKHTRQEIFKFYAKWQKALKEGNFEYSQFIAAYNAFIEKTLGQIIAAPYQVAAIPNTVEAVPISFIDEQGQPVQQPPYSDQFQIRRYGAELYGDLLQIETMLNESLVVAKYERVNTVFLTLHDSVTAEKVTSFETQCQQAIKKILVDIEKFLEQRKDNPTYDAEKRNLLRELYKTIKEEFSKTSAFSSIIRYCDEKITPIIAKHNDYCEQKGIATGQTGNFLALLHYDLITLINATNVSNDDRLYQKTRTFEEMCQYILDTVASIEALNGPDLSLLKEPMKKLLSEGMQTSTDIDALKAELRKIESNYKEQEVKPGAEKETREEQSEQMLAVCRALNTIYNTLYNLDKLIQFEKLFQVETSVTDAPGSTDAPESTDTPGLTNAIASVTVAPNSAFYGSGNSNNDGANVLIAQATTKDDTEKEKGVPPSISNS